MDDDFFEELDRKVSNPAAAIVGVNGVDLRKLAGKKLTIQGRDGKKKSVDVAG